MIKSVISKATTVNMLKGENRTFAQVLNQTALQCVEYLRAVAAD